MIESIKLVPGKRKYLFITDQLGKEVLKPLIDQAGEEALNNEVIEIKNAPSESIKEKLQEQKMGTFLYAAASWNLLEQLQEIAQSLGYSEEESHFIGCGAQVKRIFCCRCHGITLYSSTQNSVEHCITCDHCRLELEVSEHYSPLQHAYLGYVLKL